MTEAGGNDAFLVVLADAGTHAMMQGWIPAFTGI